MQTNTAKLQVPSDGPVVVVVDGAPDRLLLKRALLQSSITNEVEEFQNGQDFLEYMAAVAQKAAISPALVLLDAHLPGLNGFDVLEALRAIPAFLSRPAVAMVTEFVSIEGARRAGELGADRLIEKARTSEEYAAELDATFLSGGS